MSIYREYDIRGIYEKELNEETITRLGYALADEMKQYGEYVAVGYDARSHSPILFEYLTAGLNAGGMKVLGMGMVPTPVNYFCNYQEFNGVTACASVMITGSHNPSEYNGFKITIDKLPFIEFVISETINGYDLQDPKAKESALHESLGYIKTLSPLLQEEYRPFTASKLGISPSLIRLGNAQNTQHKPIQFSHHDIWELSFIKTLIERPHITDSLLDFIDGSLLQYHGSEFEAALRGEVNDPRLSALMMDDRIRIFDGDEGLKQELITFLTAHYNRELKKLTTQNTVSFDQKSYLIRQFRDKIERLKRGELVPLS